MKQKPDRLAQRRAQLVAQAEAQREQLSRYCQQLEPPIRLVENGYRFAKSLRRSPLLVAGLAALLLKSPWRKLARIPKFAWSGWKALQIARQWAR